MKKIIATVIALGAAGPAVAGNQLETELGVEAGQYTLNQLVVLKNAESQSGNDALVNLKNAGNVGAPLSSTR